MTKSVLRSLTFLLSAALVAAPLAAQSNSPVAKAQLQARKLIEQAITAHGGAEALRAVKTIEYRAKGVNTPRFQTTTVAAPYEAGPFEEKVFYDLGANKLSFENTGNGQGFAFHTRTVVAGNEGKTVNYTAGTVGPLPPNPQQAPVVVQYQRRLPILLLQQANNRLLTARYLGAGTFEGRKHDIVTFTMPDAQQVALYIDATTHLLSKYENVFTDSVYDTDVLEFIYGGYKQVGDLKLPSQFLIKQAGMVTSDWKVDITLNPTLDEKAFALNTEGLKELPAQPAPFQAKTVKLADNVALIQGLQGGNYNVLAVSFKDHIFAFEAPVSSAIADQAIKMIKEAFPGKPIKYVAVTHFHNDHSGGLRSFIAEGATVVTTAGNRAFFEQMAAAKFDDGLGKKPRKPAFEIVSGKRAFSDGETAIELHDIGSPHAKEMLVGYLPKERILFQGDLFFAPNDERFPIGPAAETTTAFFTKLKGMSIPVDKLVGVHGRVSTVDELAKSVSEKPGNGVKAAGQ